VNTWAKIQLGYGHFPPGDYVRSSAGSVPVNQGTIDAIWFYAQASVYC